MNSNVSTEFLWRVIEYFCEEMDNTYGWMWTIAFFHNRGLTNDEIRMIGYDSSDEEIAHAVEEIGDI